MSICLYQGTFNPIHKIHLEVAKFAKEYYNFDKIIFIPAYMPPHKTVDKTLATHRFNMVKLAIKNIPFFNISDIEYKFRGNSYTYNTIVKLKNDMNIDNKINFIIGTDAFEKIESWYKTNELKELVHFIIFPRTNSFNKSDFNQLKEKGYDFEFAPMKYKDVSSTQIRRNLRNGESIKGLEIPQVMEYIKENDLYK
ncbi:TPA: nicotinate (nicotinamide) nucleotide adenylyltransferase [Candidatus Gastranaerophilales bacterium HUM_9]|nr:MAG TPA: nicotinate (nicotinamide) nucleotide adenylyltransferase [Candidatus Gastranaerophilales bacterium HUM_9]HBX35033.1 nicotinate (nicotinamide) nucleotide adenylyltransferase [Cyanobacteria bacterium UBA11440]